MRKTRFILDADLRKCFDRINHDKHVEKVGTFPNLRKQIYAWLKAGIMDTLLTTHKSRRKSSRDSSRRYHQPLVMQYSTTWSARSLLCNIALHGMHEVCLATLKRILNKNNLTQNKTAQVGFIRYADDFLVIHPNQEVLLEMKTDLAKFFDIFLFQKDGKKRHE